MSRIALFTAILLAATQAYAQDCVKQESLDRLMEAQEEEIILGLSTDGGVPTLFVDRAVWTQIDINIRTNIALDFQCALVGADSVLREATIADAGGATLATWDGIERRLEIEQ